MTPNKLVFFLITISVIILMTSQGSSSVKHGGKSEACAACKYHRRRCTPDCILRPYFPASRHQEIRNVNRLYGLHRVEKMFKRMTPEEREDAAKSITYEANMRSRFPSYGCTRFIRQLQNQIALLTAELSRTRTQITAAAAAAAFNPSAAFFYPPAADPNAINFFDPHTVNFFNPAAFNFFIPTATVESELINPSPNLVANNDDLARAVAVSDGTIDSLSGGGQCCDIAYEEECVTEPRTSANNNDVQQSIPNLAVSDGTINFLSGGGQCCDIAYEEECVTEPGASANNNDVQQSIPNPNNLGSSLGPADDFDFVAALEASGGAPPNDDLLREFDFGFTDAERSFFGIQDSGDKCADQSLTKGKDDDFPFP